MHKVVHVKPLRNYKLFVEFEDGLKGEVDLSSRLFGPVFLPLKDQEFFSKVTIDEFGVVCWPNQADIAPDALYQRLLNDYI